MYATMNEQVPPTALSQPTREQPFIAVLEWMGAERIFGEPETRATWLRQTSWTEADRYLTWTNVLCRQLQHPDRSREPRQSTMAVFEDERDSMLFDDITSNKVVYIAPEIHHRKPVMCRAFETAQQLPDLESAATLLRMAIFLTHRYSNGNTRLGAVVDSLLTRGYDSSAADKDFYRKLTKGREGIIENGIDIQTAFLGEEFATRALAKTVRRYDYDGELPLGLTRYWMPDLSKLRPDLDWRVAGRVSLQLAERFMGQVLLTEHMLKNGQRPDQYGERTAQGDLYIPAEELFATFAPLDLDNIIKASNSLKCSFVHSTIDCFRGDETIYGPYQTVAQRMRASETTSGDTDAGTAESVA